MLGFILPTSMTSSCLYALTESGPVTIQIKRVDGQLSVDVTSSEGTTETLSMTSCGEVPSEVISTTDEETPSPGAPSEGQPATPKPPDEEEAPSSDEPAGSTGQPDTGGDGSPTPGSTPEQPTSQPDATPEIPGDETPGGEEPSTPDEEPTVPTDTTPGPETSTPTPLGLTGRPLLLVPVCPVLTEFVAVNLQEQVAPGSSKIINFREEERRRLIGEVQDMEDERSALRDEWKGRRNNGRDLDRAQRERLDFLEEEVPIRRAYLEVLEAAGDPERELAAIREYNRLMLIRLRERVRRARLRFFLAGPGFLGTEAMRQEYHSAKREMKDTEDMLKRAIEQNENDQMIN